MAIDSVMTDTAKLCDYVSLTAVVFEEEDIYYSSMYHHYVQYGKKLAEPQGEAKSDRWIWTELAKRLGFGELFDYSTEDFLKMGLSSLEKEGITLEQLKEKGHMPLPVKQVPWSDFQFLTPSGKFEFVSSLAEEKGYSGLPQLEVPEESVYHDAGLAGKYPYTPLSIHPRAPIIHSTCRLLKSFSRFRWICRRISPRSFHFKTEIRQRYTMTAAVCAAG